MPVGLRVAIALGAYDPVVFLAASMMIVGAHHVAFVSLYGMRTSPCAGEHWLFKAQPHCGCSPSTARAAAE